MDDCLFCKIIRGDIPCQKLYEDDATFAFLDIRPVNPGHTMVVPKKHVADALSSDDATLASVAAATRKVGAALMRGVGAQGVNIVINNGVAAGQVIFHLHAHVIPRFEGDGVKHWPGREYAPGEASEVAAKISAELSA